MVSAHHNCPLCPVSYQFRFYKTSQQLDEHIRGEHLVCETCYDLHSGSLVAFSRHSEYEDHMRNVHHVRNVSLNDLLLGSSRRQMSQHQTSGTGRGPRSNSGASNGSGAFIDLDMSSRDPNNISSATLLRQELQNTRNFAGNSSSAGGTHELALDGDVQISPNMRVAGQIVGGQYSTIIPSQAAALQEASTASYAHYTDSIRRSNLSLASQSEAEAFPSLGAISSGASSAAGAAEGDTGTKKTGSSTKLHELSLVNKRRATLREKRRRRKRRN